jgi:SSS family solute:Na+ symporter
MSTFVFLAIIVFSLIVALAAKRGHDTSKMQEYLIASRQFGSAIFFFLAAG